MGYICLNEVVRDDIQGLSSPFPVPSRGHQTLGCSAAVLSQGDSSGHHLAKLSEVVSNRSIGSYFYLLCLGRGGNPANTGRRSLLFHPLWRKLFLAMAYFLDLLCFPRPWRLRLNISSFRWMCHCSGGLGR